MGSSSSDGIGMVVGGELAVHIWCPQRPGKITCPWKTLELWDTAKIDDDGDVDAEEGETREVYPAPDQVCSGKDGNETQGDADIIIIQ